MLHLLFDLSGMDRTEPAVVNPLPQTEPDALAHVDQFLLELERPLLEVSVLKTPVMLLQHALLPQTQRAHLFGALH